MSGNNMRTSRIMDVTLRDGSYAINFQFTAADTAIIGGALDQAGFDLIEVGHGVGLHASEAGHGEAVERDEAYLKAAAESITRGKFGMFCIPGIARLEDIDMAAGFGMGFIRVGTNVTQVRESEPFIARAKQRGMLVCSNFMKSYALSPQEFAQTALLSQRYGTDVLYVVDSAGGMLAGDVEAYIRAVQSVCALPIGFHGHDNMGLAISNSLRAVELGAAIVDSSLQGLGRSAGNAPTEMLVVALQKMGYDLGIDPLRVMDIGETYIRPLVRRRGYSSLDIVTGQAQFHSSYMGTIRKFASKYGVDPRRLIMEVTKVDKVNAPDGLVEKLAVQLQSTSAEVVTARYEFDEYFGHEQDEGKERP
jgi:4-hydroxy 2-oxovalerate aldolase